jgi:hypothetical protein
VCALDAGLKPSGGNADGHLHSGQALEGDRSEVDGVATDHENSARQDKRDPLAFAPVGEMDSSDTTLGLISSRDGNVLVGPGRAARTG